MPKTTIENLTGKIFGRLQVIEFSYKRNNKYYWLCKCNCGNYTSYRADLLKNGKRKSCGCINNKHGLTKNRTFLVWNSMMQRCYNPNSDCYHRYGARGIVVCERWHDPINFIKDMGEKPNNMSIDRIDNNGNYEPINCRWATRIQQMNNFSRNRIIEYNGEILNATQWGNKLGINPHTLTTRLDRGWSKEEAFNTEVL